MKRLWNSFKIAFSMYSRIPMPKAEWTQKNISYAMCFFPWIGGVIGALTYAIYHLEEKAEALGAEFGLLFFTIALVILPVLITGGIHLDGFLDTKDALSSYQTKERRLEILKDPHAGAFAIISCAVYMLSYVGIYSALTEDSVKIIALSFVLSRSLSGLSVVSFPQARKKGLAATFSENAQKQICRIVLGVYVVILCVVILYIGRYRGIACILVAGAVFVYYYRMSMKHFGGITGDLAGYFLQLCEILMAAAVVITDVTGRGMGV